MYLLEIFQKISIKRTVRSQNWENYTPWDFWQINQTELLVWHLAHNPLIDKGGDTKLCVTTFSSCYVLSMRALSCMRRALSCMRGALSCKIEGVYLYEHFKITKSYQNYHFFSRNQ